MQIAAFARGFFSALGVQNFGEGLRQCADFIQPVYEMSDLIGLNKQVVKNGTNAVTPVGLTSLITVPERKVWKVLAGSINSSGVAAVTVNRLAATLSPAQSPGNLIFLTEQVTGAVAELSETTLRGVPIWVAAGSVFSCWIGTITGAANTPVNLNLLVEEYDG